MLFRSALIPEVSSRRWRSLAMSLMVLGYPLGGVLGGVLAIPFTAALRVIMFRYVWRRRQTAGNGVEPGGPVAAADAPTPK